jgi:hypothetical protein
MSFGAPHEVKTVESKKNTSNLPIFRCNLTMKAICREYQTGLALLKVNPHVSKLEPVSDILYVRAQDISWKPSDQVPGALELEPLMKCQQWVI